ncbi:hypothetical protein PHYSODRAFT_298132 [Phytophthora sojae]|uniref:Uncharacterized protein n=1 Tax=Phytophthora sojae (strain P6497) TaxID=1094619 RepID=G4Z827_PHYSP|nr:hypothetical protein PHYSODRAFT_298132 [Phytophthora sojae]EGZ19682.1 hypothetical protein PHYSODRAFT_298132 [Phytophthora sojae]|eukprot:XP_009522399.1 hypothetical protein PHYSODRAFT_298132 [Phytophthora sojae]
MNALLPFVPSPIADASPAVKLSGARVSNSFPAFTQHVSCLKRAELKWVTNAAATATTKECRASAAFDARGVVLYMLQRAHSAKFQLSRSALKTIHRDVSLRRASDNRS